MSDASLCNLCDYRTLVNEARDRGAETWLDDTSPPGLHLFVVPKGEKPDLRLRQDYCFGPQRKMWVNELPPHCTCGEKVRLKHPPSTWRPDAASEEPEPEPKFIGAERETLSLV